MNASTFGTLFLQGKWDVPIPKVKAVSEAEVFRVVQSGKRKSTLHPHNTELCTRSS